MIEVVNLQRKVPVDCERWQAFVTRVLKVVPAERSGVTIAFVSDRAMRRLNRHWRGIRGTTDVLSFRAEQNEVERQAEANLGDVVISVERASSQSKEHGLSLDSEIAQLILHGVLHLCGYNHETDGGEMNQVELRLRRRLEIE